MSYQFLWHVLSLTCLTNTFDNRPSGNLEKQTYTTKVDSQKKTSKNIIFKFYFSNLTVLIRGRNWIVVFFKIPEIVWRRFETPLPKHFLKLRSSLNGDIAPDRCLEISGRNFRLFFEEEWIDAERWKLPRPRYRGRIGQPQDILLLGLGQVCGRRGHHLARPTSAWRHCLDVMSHGLFPDSEWRQRFWNWEMRVRSSSSSLFIEMELSATEIVDVKKIKKLDSKTLCLLPPFYKLRLFVLPSVCLSSSVSSISSPQ